MKKMFAAVLLLLFPLTICADYSSYFALGKDAYAAKDYDAAFSNFKKAYAEKPTEELKAYLNEVGKNLAPKQKERSNNDFKKIVLLGSDIILSATAAWAYLDYSGSSTAYETLYTVLNKTNAANYNILIYDKKQVENKGIYMAVMSGAAGLAIIYTLGDLFFFHNAFDVPVQFSVNPGRQYAGLSKEWRF